MHVLLMGLLRRGVAELRAHTEVHATEIFCRREKVGGGGPWVEILDVGLGIHRPP